MKIPSKPGLTVTELMNGVLDGRIKALYIMGENPILSDPNMNHVTEALTGIEFLVSQDIFLNETAQLADVVLPGVSFAEKEGTFTNTERRVQRVRPGNTHQRGRPARPGNHLRSWPAIERLQWTGSDRNCSSCFRLELYRCFCGLG